MAEKKNTLYVSYIEKMTPEETLPGVEKFLQELRNAGIGIALGSASKNAPMILERIQLSGMFDAIVDGNSISEAKPNPEVFLKGAEKLGVLPENCVVFEDAIAGIEAPKMPICTALELEIRKSWVLPIWSFLGSTDLRLKN